MLTYLVSLGDARRFRPASVECELLYTNSNNLCLVCVLYRDVNWHFLPLPVFCFLFSQLPAALRYEIADCEHLQWLQKSAFW